MERRRYCAQHRCGCLYHVGGSINYGLRNEWGEIGWVGLMLGKEETRNACTVMTAAAVSAQDEFQTGLAAAEPQLCMNLQLARNSLALIAGWCCLGRVLPAVPFNLRSYQAGCE